MGELKFLTIKNMTDTTADLYFYGDIVSDWWGAWQDEDQYPDNIKNFLSGCAGKDLNVYVNSGGGSVFAGIAIYNMIKRHAQNQKVRVHVDGLAGSIASLLPFAGSEKPVIPSNAFMFIHNPWTNVDGNAEQLRKTADDLDQIREGIINIYMDHVKEGITRDTIVSMMDKETWLNGAEAAEYFDIEPSQAVEAVAAAGEFMKWCKNAPETIRNRKTGQQEAMDKKKRELIDKAYVRALGRGE